MVGRTPEYLGKKIGGREIKLTMIGVLVMPVGLLIMLAAAVTTDAGTASIFNAGPQGFGEAYYAYTSQFNNNGSAFAGYGVTEMSATLGGVAMLIGRFVPILAVLALAGALSTKPVAPFSAGTLRTTTPDLRRDPDLRDHPGRRAHLPARRWRSARSRSSSPGAPSDDRPRPPPARRRGRDGRDPHGPARDHLPAGDDRRRPGAVPRRGRRQPREARRRGRGLRARRPGLHLPGLLPHPARRRRPRPTTPPRRPSPTSARTRSRSRRPSTATSPTPWSSSGPTPPGCGRRTCRWT